MSQNLLGQNLSKTYSGRTVVNGISLSVAPGEVVGLLGPNGAGKTTSFYMMVGLVKSDTGSIFIGDENVTSMSLSDRAKKGVGYLPQEASVFRELTVEENIYSVCQLRDISRRKKESILEELILDFSLSHIRRNKGRSLSGGERRRVEIARTLALNPQYVLLDEPFAGVDPLAVNEIQTVIVSLKKRGIGVLITDHNVRETLGVVERAYIMNQGEILIEGAPDEIAQSEIARKFYLGEEFKL